MKIGSALALAAILAVLFAETHRPPHGAVVECLPLELVAQRCAELTGQDVGLMALTCEVTKDGVTHIVRPLLPAAPEPKPQSF